MLVKVYLSSSCVVGDPDPIPLSNSDHSPKPIERCGFGLVNSSFIECVYPYDGDLTADRCLIHMINEKPDSHGYVSDEFQKLKNHFFLEF